MENVILRIVIQSILLFTAVLVTQKYFIESFELLLVLIDRKKRSFFATFFFCFFAIVFYFLIVVIPTLELIRLTLPANNIAN